MDTPTSEIVSQISSRDFQILIHTANYVSYISKKPYFKNYNFARNSVSDVVKFSKNKNSYFLLEVVGVSGMGRLFLVSTCFGRSGGSRMKTGTACYCKMWTRSTCTEYYCDRTELSRIADLRKSLTISFTVRGR